MRGVRFFSLILLWVICPALVFSQTADPRRRTDTVRLQKAELFGISNPVKAKDAAISSTSLSNKSKRILEGGAARKYRESRDASFGLGIGLDYGGIGARLTLIPDPHVGLFVSGGYALVGAGFNGGMIIRMQPHKKYVPTLSGMYGYNAALVIKNASQYISQFNKLYYGASVGIGLISKPENHKGYWHYEIILPFRSSNFDTDYNMLKNNPNVTISSSPWPVLFSFGYHF